MPNAVRLAPAPFIVLSQIPLYPVSVREGRGGSFLSSVRGFALLLLLCRVLYVSAVDPASPAGRSPLCQAMRQMLATGDFFPDPLSERSAEGGRYSLAATALLSMPEGGQLSGPVACLWCLRRL
jgi:hypothetical protein